MIWPAFKLSFIVVTLATLLVGVSGIGLGFVLAKRQFPGKEFCDAVVTLPMVLPPTVTGYYLILLLGRNGLVGQYIYRVTGWSLAFTWEGAVVAASVMSLPIMAKSARAALESVDARFEMVSYSLGKGELETFFRVTLPLAFRGIMAGVVLSFARALGEFGATLMLAGNIPGKTQTMPLAIFEAFIAGEDREARALAFILTFTSIFTVYITNILTRPEKTA
jgi:molybdate transport system permease protein